MIDFRYHVVSLVAVFMALAVGIVLGAGPLGQEISSTLESQVKDLREERNGLRAQLDQAEARDELKDKAIATLTPAVTVNQLAGRQVGVLALPGADRNIVGQLQERMAAAGADVLLTARLDEVWIDPEAADTRHEIAVELAPSLAEPEPREGGEPTTETIIAAALTGQDEMPGSGAWHAATDRLQELDILATNWVDSQVGDGSAAPDTFVLVTGDLDVQDVEEKEGGDPRLQQTLDLVAAFGDLGVPTVVAGYGTESYADPIQAAESPVIRGVRAESAIAEKVSTVDNVEGAAGQLAAVLGLRWAIEGDPGHWGIGTDAVAPMPAVPEPIPVEPEEQVPAPTLPTDPTLPVDPTLPADPTLPEDPGTEGPIPPPEDGGAEATAEPGTADPATTTEPMTTTGPGTTTGRATGDRERDGTATTGAVTP